MTVKSATTFYIYDNMLLYITLRIRIIFALDGFILAWISSGFISTIGDILNKISSVVNN